MTTDDMTSREALAGLADAPGGNGAAAVSTATATASATSTAAAGAVTSAPAAATTAAPSVTLTYNPAFDGIRGLAVAAVMLFHGGFAWARGGYLGVSTFFTLSGFLITSLLVTERRATGRIALGRFWSRRVRRLFPASAVTLAAISLSAIATNQLWERSLRGDVVAALFQIANWRFLFDHRSYAELFSSPSPVLHFWSLAIEEQFYWVFPLLTAAVFGLAKGSLKVYAAVLAGLIAASAVLSVALGTNEATTVYYATYTRMGEILVGSLLAVFVARGLPGGVRVARLAAAAGVAALAVSVWAWWNVEQTTPAISEGGLLVYALVSGCLVLSATVAGPVRRVLAVEPLRRLGLISYGVYLVHWPIFLVLDGERTGLSRGPLFVVRLAVTLVVATASYVLLELPIRSGWRPRRLPMPALAGSVLATVAVVALVVPVLSAPPPDRVAEYLAAIRFQDPANIPATAKLGVTFGDSTMLETSMGLSAWGRDTEDLVLVGGIGNLLGCGVGRGGERESRGKVGSAPAGCDSWAETIPRKVARLRQKFGRLDFAIIETGPWDVANRKLPGDSTWRAPGDPIYDRYLRGELAKATDLFLHQGLVVVWLTAPHIDVGRNDQPPPAHPYPESDPARMDRLNQLIGEVADQRQGAVVVDLAGHLASLPGGEMDPKLRPDGVHLSVDAATNVAQWLGPAVLRALVTEPAPPVPPAR